MYLHCSQKTIMTTLLAAFTVLTFSNCKKDKDDKPEDTTTVTAAKLQNKKWKTVAATITPKVRYDENPDHLTNNLYADVMDACEKDNFFQFLDNGVLRMNEGADICEEEQQTSDYQWQITNGQLKLPYFEDGFINPTFTVEKCTKSEMRFTIKGKIPTISDQEYTITFTATSF